MLPESCKNKQKSYPFEYQVTKSNIFIAVVLKDTSLHVEDCGEI